MRPPALWLAISGGLTVAGILAAALVRERPAAPLSVAPILAARASHVAMADRAEQASPMVHAARPSLISTDGGAPAVATGAKTVPCDGATLPAPNAPEKPVTPAVSGAASVHLSITGTEGADVLIDGRLVGLVPLQLTLPVAPAVRHIAVHRSGYARWRYDIAGDRDAALVASLERHRSPAAAPSFILNPFE
jgi:hypothetical protein